MPVTSLLTSLETFNGAPTFQNYSGGSGAGVNDDIIAEGIQSGGRRVDNATAKGFGVTVPTSNLSAAGQHVKIWLFVTQWSSVTRVLARVSSGSDDDHELPVAEFPDLGGFIPVWVDVSRTPEVGGAANVSAINEIGVLLDIGNVGGNSDNLILDEIMHGTSGLRWDGTGGSVLNFRTYEDTNNEGNLITLNGVDFVYSRLELGSAVATTFSDSGFTLIFPDQGLVASDFMGLSVDLSNASTVIDLSNATIQSAAPNSATKRPDIVVTGTSGALDLTNMNILGMRTVILTSGVTVLGGILDSVSLQQGAATITSADIKTRSTSGTAFSSDVDFNTLTESSFTQSADGHAIEITTPGTYTLSSLDFVGYGADGTLSAAIYNNSGGAVTLNLSGTTGVTVRNGTGASTQVNNAVTLTVTGIPNGLEARLRLGAVTLPGQYIPSVTGNQAIFSVDAAVYAGRTATLTIGGVADDLQAYERQDIQIEIPNQDQSIPLGFLVNPSYL